MPKTPKLNKKTFMVAVGAVFTALAAAVLLLSCVKRQYLRLDNAMTGKKLLCVRAENGTVFSVSFMHSVNKSPVFEEYRVIGSSIYLENLRYKSFGAGMPTEAEENQIMTDENGDLVISGFDRKMASLVYSIGRYANHTLHLGTKEIPLNTLDEPGQPVEFSIGEYSLISTLLCLNG